MVNPQLAKPGPVRIMVDNEANIQLSICEYCGEDVLYCGQDIYPNWYHRQEGSRVCGIKDVS